MEQAKNAVSSFLSRGGKSHTDVDEVVNPAVTSETVKPHRHEETTEAIDKEVHQDHYHTTVQPLQHREVLPEQHTHNLAPQVEKTYEHGDREATRSQATAELSQFRDTQNVQETTHSVSAAPVVAGEHVHHHVHETVQPVIHKETVQPEVVHTVIPIHEKHTAPSEHHGLSILPTKTLGDLEKAGHSVTQSHHSKHEYDGHPRPYNSEFQEIRKPVDVEPRKHEGTHDPEKTGHFDHLKHDHDHDHDHTGTTVGAGAAGASTALASTGPDAGFRDSTRDTSGGIGSTGTGTEFGSSRGLQDERSTGHGNSAAMGSGVAGVAAGSVAQDLGRDHTRASNVTDLDKTDVRQPASVGDSGAHAAGTALGGRTEGNTASRATDAVTSNTGFNSSSTAPHHQKDQSLERTISGPHHTNEPTNLSGGTSKPHSSEHDAAGGSESKPHASERDLADDSVQHASKIGEDPSLVTSNEKGGKLTGQGQDGSHSAVFGLTPDGHKFDDTRKSVDTSRPSTDDTSKRETSTTADTSADTGSRAAGSGTGEVANQMNKIDVAEKGHDGKANYGNDSEKPGAGVATNPV